MRSSNPDEITHRRFQAAPRGRIHMDERHFVHLLGEVTAQVATELFGPPQYKYDYEGRVYHQCPKKEKVLKAQPCCNIGVIFPPLIFVSISKFGYSVSPIWPAPIWVAQGRHRTRRVTARTKQKNRDELAKWVRRYLRNVTSKFSAKQVGNKLDS